jgi:hypothetical protein
MGRRRFDGTGTGGDRQFGVALRHLRSIYL